MWIADLSVPNDRTVDNLMGVIGVVQDDLDHLMFALQGQGWSKASGDLKHLQGQDKEVWPAGDATPTHQPRSKV